MGALLHFKAVFDYLNTPEAQAAVSYIYTNTKALCPAATAALQTNAGITYNIQRAFVEFSEAQFTYMVANARNWVTSAIASQIPYWQTSTPFAQIGQEATDSILAQLVFMQTTALIWCRVDTPCLL